MSPITKDIECITFYLFSVTVTFTLTQGAPKHNPIKHLLKYLQQTKFGYIVSTNTKIVCIN